MATIYAVILTVISQRNTQLDMRKRDHLVQHARYFCSYEWAKLFNSRI